jgi:hypothetical protein
MENKVLEETLRDISKRFAELETKIFLLQNHWQKEPYHSDQTDKIFAAISKAQGEYTTIGANSINPHFKNNYADWHTILDAILPILSKHELGLIQEPRLVPIGEGLTSILYTIVTHSSGQWISCRSLIQAEKPGNQGYGGAVTYRKRYDGCAILGISFDKDPTDDDGESERKYIEKKKPMTESDLHKPKYITYPSHPVDLISQEQLQELRDELENHIDIAQMVLDKLNIQKLADVPKVQFSSLMRRIREIKQKEEQAKS